MITWATNTLVPAGKIDFLTFWLIMALVGSEVGFWMNYCWIFGSWCSVEVLGCLLWKSGRITIDIGYCFHFPNIIHYISQSISQTMPIIIQSAKKSFPNAYQRTVGRLHSGLLCDSVSNITTLQVPHKDVYLKMIPTDRRVLVNRV